MNAAASSLFQENCYETFLRIKGPHKKAAVNKPYFKINNFLSVNSLDFKFSLFYGLFSVKISI